MQRLCPPDSLGWLGTGQKASTGAGGGDDDTPTSHRELGQQGAGDKERG